MFVDRGILLFISKKPFSYSQHNRCRYLKIGSNPKKNSEEFYSLSFNSNNSSYLYITITSQPNQNIVFSFHTHNCEVCHCIPHVTDFYTASSEEICGIQF